jgi:hypothetical protein
MRRLLLTLLCGLFVVPAVALAAPRTTGDGVLELQSVDGAVTIGTSYAQPAKGALWGQMDSGRLVVFDPVSGDGNIYVSGWESKGTWPTPGDFPDATVYRGTNLHFRVTGGKYRLMFLGKGIDLTAVGVGTAWLNGDASEDSAGRYAVDSAKWLPVPQLPTSTKLGFPVSFGTTPTTTQTTP